MRYVNNFGQRYRIIQSSLCDKNKDKPTIIYSPTESTPSTIPYNIHLSHIAISSNRFQSLDCTVSVEVWADTPMPSTDSFIAHQVRFGQGTFTESIRDISKARKTHQYCFSGNDEHL